MFQPGDSQSYSDDPGFVPKAMGFDFPCDDCLAVVCLPSFHPEEIWCVYPSGKISIVIATRSIWSSIPQRVKSSGSREWSWVTHDNFSPNCVERYGLDDDAAIFPNAVNALRSYLVPEAACCDGIAFKFTLTSNGQTTRFSVSNPIKSNLLDFLNLLSDKVASVASRSAVGQYLTGR